jgi:Putative transmembrane protein (PGPGW)
MGRPEDPEELARFDVDADGQITDADLAQVTPPRRWASIGLRGPAIVLRWFTRNLKRLVVLVLGFTVLGAGVLMLVLPGPGVLIIIAGLAILATEFVWAERAMNATLSRASKVSGAVTGNTTGRIALAISALFLISAGAVVFIVVDPYRMVGLTVALAGVVGLAVLHPRVQRWLESKQAA